MSARKHVLCMCYPAFGHYIPILELAERIVPYHEVTIVVSKSKEKDIRQRGLLPPEPIRFHPFDDQMSINLDEDFHEMKALVEVMYDQAPHFVEFISSLNKTESPLPHVDAVFCDIFHHAPCQPCYENGIPLYIVNVLPTMLMTTGLRVDENTPTIPDDTFFSAKTKGDAKDMKNIPIQKSAIPIYMDQKESLKDCKAILFNSFEELEPGGINEYKKIPLTKDKILKCIGPLMPTKENLDAECDEGLNAKITEWMNKQEVRSVVYWSFGSIAVAAEEQLIEIAKALTSLKQPFVWALRPFQQVHLPDIFKRQSEKDFDMDAEYLIVPWAPQKSLLKHKATALFVSHCGWNSTLEAVHFGVPVVAWPMFGDQHFNAALIERTKTGITVPETGMINVRTVKATEIASIIERAGGFGNCESKAGVDYTGNAKALSAKARAAISPNGQSTQNLIEVLKQI